MLPSYFESDGRLPEAVQRYIRKAFERPDADEPASTGRLKCGIRHAHRRGQGRRATCRGAATRPHATLLAKLSVQITALENLIAGCEKQLAAFHPSRLQNKIPGTTTTVMTYVDGSIVTVTRSFEAPGRQPAKARLERMDRMEETIELLTIRVDRVSAALTSVDTATRLVYPDEQNYIPDRRPRSRPRSADN
jgi:hypothetical protein